MSDIGAFQFGAFLLVLAGFVVGAITVGVCWGTSNARLDQLADAPHREATRLREEAETKLIEAATTKLRAGEST